MPVQQVGALLQRWQEATGVLGQGRVIADGMRLIAALTPQERRTLARALSEEGAPQLADRLSAVTGERVDAATAHDAARGLLSLDRDQVAHLAEVLSDPDHRRRLAHDVVSAGAAAAADGALGDEPELEDADGPPAPPVPGAPSASARIIGLPDPQSRPGSYPTESLHAFANGEVPLEDPDLGEQLLDHPGLSEPSLSTTELHEISLEPPDPGTAVGVSAGVAAAAAAGAAAGGAAAADAAAAELDVTGDRDGEQTADEAGADDVRAPEAGAGDHEAAPPVAPPDDAPAAEVAPDDLDAIDDTVAQARPLAAIDHGSLVAELRSATTAHGRFSCVGSYDLGRLEPAQALRVLDAVPAGWQRRRVAERMLASGALDGVDAGQFLRRFPSAADARFVVGSAVERGTLTIPQLTEHLPEEAIRRLHTRTGT